jgi:hypothetical protein
MSTLRDVSAALPLGYSLRPARGSPVTPAGFAPVNSHSFPAVLAYTEKPSQQVRYGSKLCSFKQVSKSSQDAAQPQNCFDLLRLSWSNRHMKGARSIGSVQLAKAIILSLVLIAVSMRQSEAGVSTTTSPAIRNFYKTSPRSYTGTPEKTDEQKKDEYNLKIKRLAQADPTYQRCTNQIVTIKRYQDKNQEELKALTRLSTPTPEQTARMAQLNSYLQNQTKAIENLKSQMNDIEAKIALRELKLHPEEH